MTIIANAAEDVNNREGQLMGISLPRISFRLGEMTGIGLGAALTTVQVVIHYRSAFDSRHLLL